jgi:hypothetical protein
MLQVQTQIEQGVKQTKKKKLWKNTLLYDLRGKEFYTTLLSYIVCIHDVCNKDLMVLEAWS